ncbi:uncharacterized protein TrAtP1_005790 [Trichoderma atroviride]|uniref:uncharacterized protein n=1 Tax=Hypocrea atroviridis TaxID=63577 RepID=UPI00332570A9|nr:hypothetical protein TrAtP1_005790 [Trichoderma atroviride]
MLIHRLESRAGGMDSAQCTRLWFFLEELQAHGPRDHKVFDSANGCELSAFIVAITRYGILELLGPSPNQALLHARNQMALYQGLRPSPEPPVRRDTQCLASHNSWPTLVWTIRRSFGTAARAQSAAPSSTSLLPCFFQRSVGCTVAAASIPASQSASRSGRLHIQIPPKPRDAVDARRIKPTRRTESA